jgi:hypothetical protein
MRDSQAHAPHSVAGATRAFHVVWAFVLLSYYWIALRARPRAVLANAVPSTHTRVHAAALPPSGSRMQQIVSAVARAASLHPLGPRCFEQALASRKMLACYGETARVVLGVNKTGDTFAAHAWVEVGGYTNDAARPEFAELTHLS